MERCILFEQKNTCSGCGACYNVCPVQAINMKEDDFGFIYPEINYEKCINCRLCKKVCDFEKIDENRIIKSKVYAVMNKQKDVILNSSSGGIFPSLSEYIISIGGSVYGCSMEYENGKLVPRHISATKKSHLKKLYGSKYVQSNTGLIYKYIKSDLIEGKTVLFCGTPCQVAGLKSFLNVEYDNLYTIDLICHGVPNARFFQEYIKFIEKSYKKTIKGFEFRNKTYSWKNFTAKVIFSDGTYDLIHSDESSFYDMFLNCEIYRDSCYNCKYANEQRNSDITLGDYWGIENVHSSYLTKNGGYLDDTLGVSTVLINSDKGHYLFQNCNFDLVKYPSNIENVKKCNKQLNEPSKPGSNRTKIFNLFINKGYHSVDSFYRKVILLKKIRLKLKKLKFICFNF